MVRYEIEKLLIAGDINTSDIPAYWNEHYKKYLGVTVPDDKQGCLQDVHWSHGSFGYFATYSLGSLYAAQLYAAIEKEKGSLKEIISAGDNTNVLSWLSSNIYQQGRFYTSEELCKKATGDTLNSTHFVTYAHEKYKNIYSI
jgi:carboxypeptidase Taq